MPTTMRDIANDQHRNRTAAMVFSYRDDLEQIARQNLEPLTDSEGIDDITAAAIARKIAEAILRRFEVNEPGQTPRAVTDDRITVRPSPGAITRRPAVGADAWLTRPYKGLPTGHGTVVSLVDDIAWVDWQVDENRWYSAPVPLALLEWTEK